MRFEEQPPHVIVRRFLELPQEVKPVAYWLDADNNMRLGDVWQYLREYIAAPTKRRPARAGVLLRSSRQGAFFSGIEVPITVE